LPLKTYAKHWAAEILATGYIAAGCPRTIDQPAWKGGVQGAIELLTKSVQRDLTETELNACYSLTQYANYHAVQGDNYQATYPVTFIHAAYMSRTGSNASSDTVIKMQREATFKKAKKK
jgi:hypothetical protein